MLKNQPRVLTPEESAFAAKHFTQVYAFLAENNLSEDDYYDSAINGFLKAVQEHITSAGSGDFKQFAAAMMSAECTEYEEKLNRTPTVLSFSECYKSAYELEETIADVKSTMDEAISAISLEETMRSFNATQQRIVHLLMKGYSRMDKGNLFFIPKQYLSLLNLLEDYIESLSKENLNPNLVHSNSMFVVDDERQRQKMTDEFYANYKRDIEFYQERIQHFIDSGCESKAVIQRWLQKINALQMKKRTYEEILQRQLDNLNNDYAMLQMQGQELAVRNVKGQSHLNLAA